MGELSKLPNIGKVVEQQLMDAGIRTGAELSETGAENAWLRIQRNDPSACIHRLLGLEGAICGVPKAALPPERKAELKAFYQAHKL
ncbi:MAG: TfoX/Sxy family protein [Clostridiales bacterium]|nr:TfoX/Sxy family protein [Clostridiales bacterium]